MTYYKKGLEARQQIIEDARVVFNQSGLQLTLNDLANQLGMTKGRITNYFPTKDDLFVALSKDYDIKFDALMRSFDWTTPMTFRKTIDVYGAIMDLQYEHRSTIVFAATTNSNQKEMHEQVTQSYRANSKGVAQSARTLIDAGLLSSDILEKKEFAIFSFQYVNLFTTWIISLEIYHSATSYKRMKPVYIKGILRCFLPYLTKKGQAEFKMLNI